MTNEEKTKAFIEIHRMFERLCHQNFKEHRYSCSECILNKMKKSDGKFLCNVFSVFPVSPIVTDEDIEKVIEIIQKWNEENPRKTYLQDFLEKFPQAKKSRGQEIPIFCVQSIYGNNSVKCLMDTGSPDCFSCWNTSMPEEEEK